MPLYAPVGGSYEIPDEGVVQGVCVDVIDRGEMESTFNGKTEKKRKVEFVFQVAQNGSNGAPLQVSKLFNLTLGPKATLRKFLEGWRGKPFADDEAARFDLESVKGKNAQIGIMHATGKQGGKFANIATVMALLKGMPEMAPRDYVRKERKQQAVAPDAYTPQPGDPF